MCARRDTRAKSSLGRDALVSGVVGLLDEIQAGMLAKARQFRDDHTAAVDTYEQFTTLMEGRPGFVAALWCGSATCEAQIKAETQATVRNIPFGRASKSGACIKCGQPASVEAFFAKAY